MHEDLIAEWQAALEKILDSDHPRKVVVAGPGAGKTSLFKKMLEKSRGAKPDANHLVVTFINDLTDELRRDLGDLANVYTFHGYCKQALHRNPYLREGLREDFEVFPKLPTIVKRDWEIAHPKEAIPKFVDLMRKTVDDDATRFFIDRSNYYNTVSFDDIVFRVFRQLIAAPNVAEAHDLILVDEYQDFNLLEVSLLEILSKKAPIVFAGDDDQVLYGAFRGSTWNYIRDLYTSVKTESCELPFCLRCPKPIVLAVDDIVKKAAAAGKLVGRIPKSYRYYPPAKETDTVAHPKIMTIQVSTQTAKANYFGKFIEYVAKQIPPGEIKKSRDDGFPTILVIGNIQYLRQVSDYLRAQGYVLDEREPSEPGADDLNRDEALRLIKADAKSRLGWRVVIEIDQPEFWKDVAGSAIVAPDISAMLPDDYRKKVLAEADVVADETELPKKDVVPPGQPTIKLTSFQGAKGLSAQYVFVVGLHNKDLPRDPSRIDDIEICKFLVALTRTRKRCFLLFTKHFANQTTTPSIFIDWIDSTRRDHKYIDKSFWPKPKPTPPKTTT